MESGKKYSLYLAGSIFLWKEYFSQKYSPYFNHRVRLFEPGTLDTPGDHRKIPIWIACYDLNEINHADALLVYMRNRPSYQGSPTGTDSAWECGYGIGHGKPVIMLIEDKVHIDYYAVQWMMSFSINAILTADKEVAEILKDHPKFVHTTILLAQGPQQFEARIIEYLDNYYRSIYSRSGIVNYYVDERARDLFSRANLAKATFSNIEPDNNIVVAVRKIDHLSFTSDEDSLRVCKFEREISDYFKNKLDEVSVDRAIQSVTWLWAKPKDRILDCLEHSIQPPFAKIKLRKQGVKKTRPELFYELYDLVTHHLIREDRFVKADSFPYDIGAIVELYNWMNTYALDDVFDNSKFRQKAKTVWFAFSRRDAIYTGILGHLLALKYLFVIAAENPAMAKTLAGIMNNYNRMMYEGQVFDIMLTFDNPKRKALLKKKNLSQLLALYVKRIDGICGGFYEAIGELAAKAGNKEMQIMNAAEVDRISPLIGMYYGIIQMIRNDLGDFVAPADVPKMSRGMKDVSHSDVTEGKTSLAYLIALYSKNLSKTEKDFLYRCLHSKLTAAQKIRINELLWKSGAIDLTVELIARLIDHVRKNLLTEYHETPTRMKWMFSLIDITKEIVIPFKRQAGQNKWVKYEYDETVLRMVASQIIALGDKKKSERLPATP